MQTNSKRVVVQKVISARYGTQGRPVRWDDRISGIETVATSTGEEIVIFSNGGQSTPEAGWEIMLQDVITLPETNTPARSWTLYGIKSPS